MVYKSIFICLSLLFLISCTDNTQKTQNLNSIVDSLQISGDSLKSENKSLDAEVNKLQQQKDSLAQQLEDILEADDHWYNEEIDGRSFIEAGIEHPEEYIKKELQDQADVIPMEGVLGGNMMFIEIKLLSSKWLIADYEDGHIQGKALFEYQLNSEGEVEFEVIQALENE